MKKSGLADSPFFKKTPQPTPLPVKPQVKKKVRKVTPKRQNKDTMTPRNRDTMQPSNHDTVIPPEHDIIEAVRKAVRELGKEAATHRFTVDEKKTIGDIIYSYKRLGTRTSENEITRIVVNFIINDYKENGKNSVLEKALKALNE